MAVRIDLRCSGHGESRRLTEASGGIRPTDYSMIGRGWRLPQLSEPVAPDHCDDPLDVHDAAGRRNTDHDELVRAASVRTVPDARRSPRCELRRRWTDTLAICSIRMLHAGAWVVLIRLSSCRTFQLGEAIAATRRSREFDSKNRERNYYRIHSLRAAGSQARHISSRDRRIRRHRFPENANEFGSIADGSRRCSVASPFPIELH